MTTVLVRLAVIPAAVLLDFLIGDPEYPLHPVRMIGGLATRLERLMRRLFPPLIAGTVTWVATVTTAVALTIFLLYLSALGGVWIRFAVSTLILYSTISSRDLARHARRVERKLRSASLPEARKALSMMVSRDTESLTETDIARATVESVAENTSDGVTGALLFFALFGPAGAVTYRTINTLDAMFGYRNEKYRLFGRVPARADDIVNLIPARLTAVTICLVAGREFFAALSVVRRDGRKHDSPNAGFPEAAVSALLKVRLGGPSSYRGVVKEKPWIGTEGSEPDASSIGGAIGLMWVATAGALVLSVVVRAALIALF